MSDEQALVPPFVRRWVAEQPTDRMPLVEGQAFWIGHDWKLHRNEADGDEDAVMVQLRYAGGTLVIEGLIDGSETLGTLDLTYKQDGRSMAYLLGWMLMLQCGEREPEPLFAAIGEQEQP